MVGSSPRVPHDCKESGRDPPVSAHVVNRQSAAARSLFAAAISTLIACRPPSGDRSPRSAVTAPHQPSSRTDDRASRSSCLLPTARGDLFAPGIISPHASTRGALGFGARTSPHSGVDWIANAGDEAIAAAPGRVDLVHASDQFGTIIVLFHPQLQLYSAYAHLDDARVKENDAVDRGQAIGSIGLFPESGGMVHLHWEVCRAPCNGELDRTIDPRADTLPCFHPSTRNSQTGFTVPMRCCRD